MAVQGTHPPTVPEPARSIRHAAKPTRSISWAAERAQAGHSPEEHARAEVGVLQRVGFHFGVHGQHLAVRAARRRLLEARVKMLELRPPRRSARREPHRQAAASGNRAPARPDPASRSSSGLPLRAVPRRCRLLEPGSGVSRESAGPGDGG